MALLALLQLATPSARAANGFGDGMTDVGNTMTFGNLVPSETPEDEQARRICKEIYDPNNPPPSPAPGAPPDMRTQSAAHCGQADLDEDAGKAQATACVTYSIAATACLTECIGALAGGAMAGGWACRVGGVAAMGMDAFGAVLVGAKGSAIASDLGSAIPSLGLGGVGMAGGFMASSSHASDVATQLHAKWDPKLDGITDPARKKEIQDELDAADKAKQKEDADNTRNTACLSALVNAAQATLRGINAHASFEKALKDRRQALSFLSQSPTFGKIEPGPAPTKIPGGEQAQQVGMSIKRGGGGGSGDGPGFNGSQLAGMADSAGMGPLMKHFEDQSGHPAQELFDRALAGQPPLLAAADMMSGQLGSQGMAAAGELNGAAGGLAAQLRDELDGADKKNGLSQSLFASAASRSGGGGGAGMALPDIHSLMAGLMPKKPYAGKNGAGGNAKFARGPAANADGLHPAERSIFEVITDRYHKVAMSLIAGETVINVPAAAARAPAAAGGTPGNIPKNPYMGK